MVCICPHDGRLSRLSSSPSSQHHSSFVLARSSLVVVVLTVTVASLAPSCLAKSFGFPPVLGQVADSQQESSEQDSVEQE